MKTAIRVAACLAYLASISDADTVTVNFTAEIVTIAGSPFGLTFAQHAGALVTGSFTYDTDVADTDPFNSPEQGRYDHTMTDPGSFTAQLPTGPIVGSNRPRVEIVNVGNSDTFRFRDGAFGFSNNPIMSFNGVSNSNIELFLAITNNSGAFTTDSLPAVFPFTTPQFAPPQPLPHTFSIEQSFSDTVLMQLLTVEQVPGGGTNDTTAPMLGNVRSRKAHG